jgi:hypothetical protein
MIFFASKFFMALRQRPRCGFPSGVQVLIWTAILYAVLALGQFLRQR